jgi:hypothetical protein
MSHVCDFRIFLTHQNKLLQIQARQEICGHLWSHENQCPAARRFLIFPGRSKILDLLLDQILFLLGTEGSIQCRQRQLQDLLLSCVNHGLFLGCYGIDESSTCGESSQVTPTHGKARTKLNETTKVKKNVENLQIFQLFAAPASLERPTSEMQSISSSVKEVRNTEGSSELMETEAPASNMRRIGCSDHGGFSEVSCLHAPVSSEEVGHT